MLHAVDVVIVLIVLLLCHTGVTEFYCTCQPKTIKLQLYGLAETIGALEHPES